MAWTSPMTFVANSPLTAAQLNAHLRDNLNETAPAKATAGGQIFVSTAANAIAARTPTAGLVVTTETTSSSAYTDLATIGPAVTVTTGTQALVFLTCGLASNTVGGFANASVEVSGATTVAAGDDRTVSFRAGIVNQQITACSSFLQALTAGSNTFTMKYGIGSGGGTGTFFYRRVVVVPL